MHFRRYDEAVSEYSAALSLDPTSSLCLLIKRSKAHLANGSWENGLQDASKARPFLLSRFVLVDDIIIR